MEWGKRETQRKGKNPSSKKRGEASGADGRPTKPTTVAGGREGGV